MAAGSAVRICLVNPRMEGPYPPLGLGYIASYLKRYGNFKYDIRIIDGNARDDLEKGIVEFEPMIVGFTGHSPQIREAVSISKMVRAWRKDVFQIIGGVHVSADAENTLRRGGFDVAVIGEGERTFTEVVDTFIGLSRHAVRKIRGTAFIEDGRFVVNNRMEQITDLDTIPFPSRDLFDMDHYLGLSFGIRGRVMSAVTSITSSRGCPYDCLFCGVGIVFKKVRHFSREYCVEEISELVSRFGVRGLYFADDTFIVDKKRIVRFCELMIKSGLARRICWTAQARANLVGWKDLELLKLMKAAGCVQLEYGFESGSDRVLGILKQNRVTVADNQRAIDVTNKAGLRILGTFIVGTPDETEADLEMTKEFIRKNLNKIDYFQTFICTPFPGSPLYDLCRRRGIVEGDYFKELERREKAADTAVYTDTLPHSLVRDTLRELDYLGIRKVSLRDRIVWVLYHLVKPGGDVSHRDRFYILRRLLFYFSSLLGLSRRSGTRG